MYNGVYQAVVGPEWSGAKLIFDISIREHPYRNVPWELVAIVRMPEGARFDSDPDYKTTHFLLVDEARFYAMDVLLGKAGPLVVWSRANAMQT